MSDEKTERGSDEKRFKRLKDEDELKGKCELAKMIFKAYKFFPKKPTEKKKPTVGVHR